MLKFTTHIEDLLMEELYGSDIPTNFVPVIKSFCNTIGFEKPLTTKQANFAEKILRITYEKLKNTDQGLSIIKLKRLEGACWRNAPTPSIEITIDMKYIGDNIILLRGTSPKITVFVNKHSIEYRRGVHIIRVNNLMIDDLLKMVSDLDITLDNDIVEYLSKCIENENNNPVIGVMDDMMVFDIPNNNLLSHFVKRVLGAEIL